MKENCATKALSRQQDETMLQFLAFTRVHFRLLDELRLENINLLSFLLCTSL